MIKKKLYINSLICLSLTGCASPVVQQGQAKLTAEFSITKFANKEERWSRLQGFKSFNEALGYALDRRLMIQRFHQLKSEPYFGTPAEKNCANNIDIKGDLKDIPQGKYFFLKVLADSNYSMGDCLRENNSQEAVYEFTICNTGDLVEVRNYHPWDRTTFKPQPYDCSQI